MRHFAWKVDLIFWESGTSGSEWWRKLRKNNDTLACLRYNSLRTLSVMVNFANVLGRTNVKQRLICFFTVI